MSAPASRPVHASVLSVFEGSTGAEYSTWAHLSTAGGEEVPNLVTAQASTLRIYKVDPPSGNLILQHSFSLAGSVCFLDKLTSEQGDSLLIGFAGHPRISIASLKKTTTSSYPILQASSLLNLTPALTQASVGSVTPLEQDLIAAVKQHRHAASLSVVLGRGVAVATLDLSYTEEAGWYASSEEPYILPLATLSKNVISGGIVDKKTAGGAALQQGTASAAANIPSIAHGFGDILSVSYLSGFLEPTLCLLHSSSKMERTWPGRLGKSGLHYLSCSAVSVNVLHKRSALLWSVHVPADAFSLQSTSTGVLVVSVNSILHIENSGAIPREGVMGVNGFVKSTLPPSLQVYANPWPLPKLSIQLDGSHVAFVSDTIALIALRRGQLYLLNMGDEGNKQKATMSLAPLGRTLGAIGQVAHLSAWPVDAQKMMLMDKLKTKQTVDESIADMCVGLLFAGSRLGDTSLFAYSIQQHVDLTDMVKKEGGGGGGGTKRKRENDEILVKKEFITNTVSPEVETILLQEEDALYAPTDDKNAPDIVPPSDDEQDSTALELDLASDPKSRTKLHQLAVLRSLTVLDSITCLGPVGPGCLGPLSRPKIANNNTGSTMGATTISTLAANAQVLPCGHGSSGGLALVTTPGRDDRTILAEADLLNVQSVFYLPKQKVVLLANGSDGGMSMLRLDSGELSEVGLTEYCGVEGNKDDDASLWKPMHVFFKTTLVSASELQNEFNENYIVLLVKEHHEQQAVATYSIVVMAEDEDTKRPQVRFVYQVGPGQGTLLSATAMVRHDDEWSPTLYFATTWSSGNGIVTTIRPPNQNDEEFTGSETLMIGQSNSEKMEVDGDDDGESTYYASDAIVSMDVFTSPKGTFVMPSPAKAKSKIKKEQVEVVKMTSSSTVIPMDGEEEFDDEDLELYGLADNENEEPAATPSLPTRPTISKDKELYIGVCRQSAMLQIYRLSVVGGTTMDPELAWEAPGCGHGTPLLAPTTADNNGSAPRRPRMHKVHTAEFRFFVCGPNVAKKNTFGALPFQKFCLAMETSAGDVYLYETQPGVVDKQTGTTFTRAALGVVGRPSNEQARHRGKLKRKGILASNADDNADSFRHNRLHPFCGISGEDGLFAATARPMWFLSERGAPTYLCHRSRHVAPAGGKHRPVAGFCSGLLSQGGGFLTLHERIGRVGSQRLTVFKGISNVYSPHGLFPGSGMCIEKVPLGVTVRLIEFLDDVTVSSRDHPLYCVLISRELESDQSLLNDDGLSDEERQRQREEKENAQVKRQVEADLGGFDIEQEWVEEIERENCVDIDKTIGGAPPISKSAYALWIVDASNNWNVVDSYELGQYEHGMTMKVMPLTEVADETGKSSTPIGEDEEVDALFITVGTGIVDQDGEDVSSKGRVLLFQVTRHKEPGAAGAIADLSLVYEKDIMHGAVTTLSCLACEGRSRLVIGAGSDVNVEQWGNGKLTQVGFFRGQMQILDIMLFKTFFLLSDAYDSLYFLVWRESDKSLTLLAKDYEPTPVYASGLMSRGGSVTFVCADDRQNLEFFQYAPGDAAARGGNKLVCRADYHLGTQTALGMQSHYCRSSLVINSATPTSTLEALKQQDSLVGRTDDDQRMGVYFGTTDGTFLAIIPLSEPAYWRFTALQSVLTNALETNCALSTRAWRLYRRTPRRGGCRSNDRKKGVIDGDLCMQYADLPLADQEDLASAIGSTVDTILDNLVELNCSSMVI